jgi:DNA repair protein RecO (recombination protein O)
MHRVFATEGIVLGKRSAGEENTLVLILTRELGLVRASARAARRENSKLRYGLETLTQSKFSLIRGKYEWKITGAQDISHSLVPKTAAGRQTAGRVAKLILRLINGEEPHEEVYTTVSEGLAALARGADVEAVLVLRILAHLGYLPDTQELKPFIERDFFSIELAEEIAASRKLLFKTINESLDATGL